MFTLSTTYLATVLSLRAFRSHSRRTVAGNGAGMRQHSLTLLRSVWWIQSSSPMVVLILWNTISRIVVDWRNMLSTGSFLLLWLYLPHWGSSLIAHFLSSSVDEWTLLNYCNTYQLLVSINICTISSTLDGHLTKSVLSRSNNVSSCSSSHTALTNFIRDPGEILKICYMLISYDSLNFRSS